MLEFEQIWKRSWDDAEPEEEEIEEVKVYFSYICFFAYVSKKIY